MVSKPLGGLSAQAPAAVTPGSQGKGIGGAESWRNENNKESKKHRIDFVYFPRAWRASRSRFRLLGKLSDGRGCVGGRGCTAGAASAACRRGGGVCTRGCDGCGGARWRGGGVADSRAGSRVSHGGGGPSGCCGTLGKLCQIRAWLIIQVTFG